jgi:hypothetical protein
MLRRNVKKKACKEPVKRLHELQSITGFFVIHITDVLLHSVILIMIISIINAFIK